MSEPANSTLQEPPRLIERFSYGERLLHWLVAIPFIGLLLSGLAFAYPSVFGLTFLFGGGAHARLVHNWLGLFFAFFVVTRLGFERVYHFHDGFGFFAATLAARLHGLDGSNGSTQMRIRCSRLRDAFFRARLGRWRMADRSSPSSRIRTATRSS